MWRQGLKGVGFFLLLVAVVVLCVWAVTSFLDRYFGITFSLPPMGYFDTEDEMACDQLEPAEQYMCAMSRKIARLEERIQTLQEGCDPPERVYIAASSK